MTKVPFKTLYYFTSVIKLDEQLDNRKHNRGILNENEAFFVAEANPFFFQSTTV